jgi:hypothetical protein
MSRQCGILNISQPYRPPRFIIGIASLYFYLSIPSASSVIRQVLVTVLESQPSGMSRHVTSFENLTVFIFWTTRKHHVWPKHWQLSNKLQGITLLSSSVWRRWHTLVECSSLQTEFMTSFTTRNSNFSTGRKQRETIAIYNDLHKSGGYISNLREQTLLLCTEYSGHYVSIPVSKLRFIISCLLCWGSGSVSVFLSAAAAESFPVSNSSNSFTLSVNREQQLWHCETVILWDRDTVTLWYLLWYYDTAILWHCDIVRLWHCDIVILWHCDIVILWHCDIVRLWHCDIVILWHCDIVRLWHCDIVRLWHCEAVTLWYCDTVAL